MNSIFLIVKREYLTRVRKKSFIVMTILAPLLVVCFYGIIIYFAINKDVGESRKNIFVSDESGLFTGKLQQNDLYTFVYGKASEEEAKLMLAKDEYYAVLMIPQVKPEQPSGIRMLSTEQPGFSTMSYIEGQLRQEIKNLRLNEYHIDPKVIAQINSTQVDIASIIVTTRGMEARSVEASTVIGFAGALLIYMFILLYGVQIMQGVIEEKTNRIVEVIISSVKPFQLMMGKIIGIALVGLTQFCMWLLIGAVFGGSLSGIVMARLNVSPEAAQAVQQGAQHNDISSMLMALSDFNYVFIIGMFLFYFIGGYLFYGALFAALGSAVDNETDKQQFMLPVTMPLVFAFVLAQSAVTAHPNGTLAFWLSVIPFTSPVTMMVRVPFGIPTWEIVLSMACMIAGFLGTVWIAARIYRIGILMYGKKPTWSELGKWLFYKG